MLGRIYEELVCFRPPEPDRSPDRGIDRRIETTVHKKTVHDPRSKDLSWACADPETPARQTAPTTSVPVNTRRRRRSCPLSRTLVRRTCSSSTRRLLHLFQTDDTGAILTDFRKETLQSLHRLCLSPRRSDSIQSRAGATAANQNVTNGYLASDLAFTHHPKKECCWGGLVRAAGVKLKCEARVPVSGPRSRGS